MAGAVGARVMPLARPPSREAHQGQHMAHTKEDDSLLGSFSVFFLRPLGSANHALADCRTFMEDNLSSSCLSQFFLVPACIPESTRHMESEVMPVAL